MIAPLALAGVLAMTSSVVLLGWALLSRPSAVAAQARDNLVRGIDLHTADPRRRGSGLAGLARGLTPAGTVARLDRLAATAGRPAAWPLARLVAAKLVLGLIAGVLSALVVLSNP